MQAPEKGLANPSGFVHKPAQRWGLPRSPTPLDDIPAGPFLSKVKELSDVDHC
jgi:hypothetical protein